MRNRLSKLITLFLALFAIGTLGSGEAAARGGGGGGGPGGGRGGPGGGRGGPGGGRGGPGGTGSGPGGMGRGTGQQGGNKGGASEKSAKEWSELREQEARLEMIKARREHLMDLDRKQTQETWLAGQRLAEADEAGRGEPIR